MCTETGEGNSAEKIMMLMPLTAINLLTCRNLGDNALSGTLSDFLGSLKGLQSLYVFIVKVTMIFRLYLPPPFR